MAGKIITIAQQKGGSGKTTLAAHLAVAGTLRKSGNSVAILDTDPQGSLGQWYLKRCEALGEDNADLELRTASAWGAKLEARNLAKTHDLVIVDTPPKADWDCRPAMDAADLVVIPILPSPVDLWATAPTVETAAKQKANCLVVLNRAVARARLTGESLEAIQELKAPVAKAQFGNRVAFAGSMGSGKTVLEIGGAGPARAEVRALADEVLGQVFAA